MATNKIDIILSAKDQTTGPINKIGKNVGSFAKKVQTDFVSIAAKVFIVQQAYRALSNVIGGLINAANRQEDAINRLNNAMRIQGSFTDELSQKYRDFAKEMQRSTRFGDEAIMELMQQLIAVGNVTEAQMFRASRAAMDFATATGRDLSTAALTVGKAMAGFTGELSRYGIILDDNVPATQKAEAALRGMEKQFGTAAQRDVNTFSGSVAQLSNSWSDFQEVLGEWITTSKDTKGLITALNTAVTFWTDKMSKSNLETAAQAGLLGDLNEKLILVNEALDANLKKQAAPFLLNRNEIEQQYNNLLEQRSRILLTIADVRNNEVDTIIVQAEKIIEAEQIKVNLIEAFHNNLSTKIKDFREKDFKDDQQKAEAKKKLHQDILNSQVSNLETFLQKAGETNKAAAVAFKVIQTGRAIINTAEAITEAMPNLPLAAFVAAMGAAQIATIHAQGFAKGTDSVPSMLTPGEMVVPRDFASAVRSGDLSISGPGGGSFGDINIFIQGGINPGGSSIDEMAEQLGFAFEREVRTARG